MTIPHSFAFIFTVILLFGCASEVARSPSLLVPAAHSERTQIEIAKDVNVDSVSTYHRVLPSGSKWELHGTVSQGKVYKRVNGIFTVEGAHVHEAYIVIAKSQLVGYYLPVEQQYSAVPAVLITLK